MNPMSPELFAHWFVRTKERVPDLRKWPAHGYNLWAFLHLNAAQAAAGGNSWDVGIRRYGNYQDYYSPFFLHDKLGKLMPREDVRSHLRESVKLGMARDSIGKGEFYPFANPEIAYGPRKGDIGEMREVLEGSLADARLRGETEKSGVAEEDLNWDKIPI